MYYTFFSHRLTIAVITLSFLWLATPSAAGAGIELRTKGLLVLQSGGTPITTEQEIRLSLWSDARYMTGDVTATGSLNTNAQYYGGSQMEIVRTPDSNGYVPIAISELENVPEINHHNLFIMVEYKPSGDPDTSYTIYQDPFMATSQIDRYPLIPNGALIFENVHDIVDRGASGTTLTIDPTNQGTTGAVLSLQFGATIAEKLQWDIDNDRFSFTDDLRINGNAAIVGQLYVADDHAAAASTGTITLGRTGSNWEQLSWNNTRSAFVFSDDLIAQGTLSGTSLTLSGLSGCSSLQTNASGAVICANDPSYGELYVTGNTSSQSFSANTFVKVTAFNSVGDNVNTTVSTSDDSITVAADGMYQVNLAISFSGDLTSTWLAAVAVNGTTVAGMRAERSINLTATTESLMVSGLVELSTNDVVTVVMQSVGATRSATIRESNLSLHSLQ